MARKSVPRSITQKCRCPLSEEGCDWTGSLEDVTEHMNVCPRSLIDVECPYKVIGCDIGLIAKREIDEHLKECQILHQQLLLKKMIGSNEQRRSVKKKYELERVWILSALFVVLSVAVLGISVFVHYQTQNDNKILKDELTSFKHDIENKLQGIDRLLKNLNDKIEIEGQSKDDALLNLKERIEDYLFKLPNLMDEKIFDLTKKMETEFERMCETCGSVFSSFFRTRKKINKS